MRHDSHGSQLPPMLSIKSSHFFTIYNIHHFQQPFQQTKKRGRKRRGRKGGKIAKVETILNIDIIRVPPLLAMNSHHKIPYQLDKSCLATYVLTEKKSGLSFRNPLFWLQPVWILCMTWYDKRQNLLPSLYFINLSIVRAMKVIQVPCVRWS